MGLQVGIGADGGIAVVLEGDLADAAAAVGKALALDLGTADVHALLWQAACLLAERQLGASQALHHGLAACVVGRSCIQCCHAVCMSSGRVAAAD